MQVVFKSFFFHNLASSIFKTFTQVILVSTICFDEVILVEIVIWGSQVMTKFYQIFFYHILTDLIFCFYFFVLWFGFEKIINKWRQVFLMSSCMALK